MLTHAADPSRPSPQPSIGEVALPAPRSDDAPVLLAPASFAPRARAFARQLRQGTPQVVVASCLSTPRRRSTHRQAGVRGCRGGQSAAPLGESDVRSLAGRVTVYDSGATRGPAPRPGTAGAQTRPRARTVP